MKSSQYKDNKKSKKLDIPKFAIAGSVVTTNCELTSSFEGKMPPVNSLSSHHPFISFLLPQALCASRSVTQQSSASTCRLIAAVATRVELTQRRLLSFSLSVLNAARVNKGMRQNPARSKRFRQRSQMSCFTSAVLTCNSDR